MLSLKDCTALNSLAVGTLITLKLSPEPIPSLPFKTGKIARESAILWASRHKEPDAEATCLISAQEENNILSRMGSDRMDQALSI